VLGSSPATNGSTVTLNCGATNIFQDPGGTSNFGNNQNVTVTFCSNGSNPLYFDFRALSSSLNLDSGTGDTLYFYDASTNSLITFLTQSDDYGFSTPSVGTTSSCVKVVWHSNSAGVDGGWDALITCTSPPTCAINLPASDVFMQAPTICNFNNYCGATNSYYGEDAPFNFSGTGGGCPSLDGLFGGTIENNSWLKFQAVTNTASFSFNVSGGGSCSGLQAGVFDYNSTTNTFTLKSPCASTNGSGLGVGNSTLTATGLVAGNVYYLMMDGTAGSVCNYNVNAISGVALANAGSDMSVCTSSATLNASTAVGTGTWTVISGTGTFSNPNSNITDVTGLNASTNIFQWTINTPFCGTISDEIAVDAGCLLPIELVRFDGDCIDNQILLSWQTASEKSNKLFVIERSLNGINFYSIGSVKGAGNSEIYNNYSFKDKVKPETVAYYRLSQIDFNGNTSQSKVISVANNCSNVKQTEIDIYPNPSISSATIGLKLQNHSDIIIEVFNCVGQLVKTIPMQTYEAGLQEVNIDSSEFSAGIYFIKTTVNQTDYIDKFIKL
jgi:hypothetical protein